MSNYFRITGYSPEDDFCFILDSNGKFEKKWQFSSLLIQKGLKVLAITDSETFIDVNIAPAEEDKDKVFLRANAVGKPKYIEQEINGIKYKTVQVADKIYIPNKEERL